jgi:hypothetical protein
MAKKSAQNQEVKKFAFPQNLVGKVVSVSYDESYSFNTHPLNRNLNIPHVKEIKKCMTSQDAMMKISPIEVNAVTGNIIDGNHRRAAFRMAVEDSTLKKNDKMLVYFICAKPEDELQLIQDKQNARKWGMEDYVEQHYKKNTPMYKEVIDFAKTHDITHKGSVVKPAYAMSVLTGDPQYQNLRNGNIRLTKAQLALGNTIHDELVTILNIFGLTVFGRHINSLAQSWHRYRSTINLKDLVNLMTRKRDVTYKEQLLRMERQNTRQWDAIFETADRFIEQIKSSNAASAKKRTATRMANKK